MNDIVEGYVVGLMINDFFKCFFTYKDSTNPNIETRGGNSSKGLVYSYTCKKCKHDINKNGTTFFPYDNLCMKHKFFNAIY